MTLGELLHRYITSRTDLKPQSRLVLQQTARTLIEFFGRDKLIDQITAGDAADYKGWLLTRGRSTKQRTPGRGLSQATVAKHLAVAATICNYAKAHKLLVENPFAGVKKPSPKNPARNQYVPVEVIEQLITEQCPTAEWRLLGLARYLGLRVPSEPMSLTWHCVDWDRARLRVPSPKTARCGKPFRVVPLLPRVRQLLAEVRSQVPADSGFVFRELRILAWSETKQSWQTINLQSRLRRMIRRAGLRPWPSLWHALRASAQTDLATRLPAHAVCA